MQPRPQSLPRWVGGACVPGSSHDLVGPGRGLVSFLLTKLRSYGTSCTGPFPMLTGAETVRVSKVSARGDPAIDD